MEIKLSFSIEHSLLPLHRNADTIEEDPGEEPQGVEREDAGVEEEVGEALGEGDGFSDEKGYF